MNEIKNQPEALRLAELIRLSGAQPGSVSDDAASELRRLHAENQDLRTRNYCNTAEIKSLRHRVQELGDMARENRSKKVIELEGRIAEMESEAEQNAKIIGASAETELALRGRIAELEAAHIAYASEFEPDAEGDPDVGNIHANIRALKAQLSAIGAGGVEPLRKRASTAYPAEGVPAQKVHPFGWFITKSKLSGDTEFTQDPVRENLAQSFGYQTKALYTHPTQQGMDAATLDALQEAESVLNSINMGKQHRVVQADGEVTYWQREEWCKWAAGEVLPKVTAALAAQAKQGEK